MQKKEDYLDLVRLLAHPSPPWIVNADCELIRWIQADLATHYPCRIVELNGNAMCSLAGCWSEFEKKLSFPSYFGQNLNALFDCLTDESVVPVGITVILISDSQELLTLETKSTREAVIDTLCRACEELSKHITVGELWDRPACPMHVVLEMNQSKV